MEDYYFRVKASDRTEMRRLLRSLNVIEVVAGEIVPKRDGDIWVEIGRIYDWQDPTKFVKDTVSGEVYWHYNMRTSINIRKRVRDAVTAGDADAIALGSAKGRWFSKVTGDEGDTPSNLKVAWL